jgi:hypothetical protein
VVDCLVEVAAVVLLEVPVELSELFGQVVLEVFQQPMLVCHKSKKDKNETLYSS